MNRNFILYSAFGIILILGVLHFVASKYYLYWTLGWYDYMMHFIAGLGGGLVAIWMLRAEKPVTVLLTSLLLVLIVGVAWEVFEYVAGLTEMTESSYALDVTHDLIMDLLGACLAAIIALRSRVLS